MMATLDMEVFVHALLFYLQRLVNEPKNLNNILYTIELESVTHHKEVTTTYYEQIIGVRLRLERCIASIMHIMLQVSNIIPTG
jgi:hypothetical protein